MAKLRKVKIEKFESEKDMKEFEFRRNILEALLYCSISRDKFIFPTIERFIFNEVIRGTIEYVTKKESNFVCPTYGVGKDGKKYYSTRSDYFEPNMWDYFQQKLKKVKNPLNSETKKGLMKLLEPSWCSDEMGDGEYQTELYLHFKGFAGGGICPVIMQSTFSLPQSIIYHVEKKVLPSLSGAVNKDVHGIGKSMRRYIEKDLHYIKGHYHW